MWQLYKTRKENLEKLLKKKKDELKQLCVKESVRVVEAIGTRISPLS
jgi:hypothetical protein